MKKLLYRILTVVAAAVSFYIVVVFSLLIFGNVNWLPNVKYTLGGTGHTLLRLQEAKKQQNVDILFIGSSQVYRGFDPRIFKQNGINSFNLGTSSQTPFDSYFLLKANLEQLNPKYVVMDLFWEILSEEGVEAGVDIISNSEVDSTVFDLVWQRKNAMLLNTLLVSSTRNFVQPLSDTDQQKYKEDKYVTGGFTETYRRENAFSAEKLNSLRPYSFKTADLQLEYMHKIVELCREKQVKLIFVVTPVTKELKGKVVNYEEYTSIIADIAQKNHLPLIDYNNRLDLYLSSQNDFLDANHLSQSGVVKFNQLLIGDLQRIKSFYASKSQSPAPNL